MEINEEHPFMVSLREPLPSNFKHDALPDISKINDASSFFKKSNLFFSNNFAF